MQAPYNSCTASFVTKSFKKIFADADARLHCGPCPKPQRDPVPLGCGLERSLGHIVFSADSVHP